jgi:uncharacterized protein (TIGR03435 family)
MALPGMTFRNIAMITFHLPSLDLVVAPDWTNDLRFDITAKVPSGATHEQLYIMLQNLLVERFGLRFHAEDREIQGYRVTVARGGPKFRELAPEPPRDPASPDSQPPPRRRATRSWTGRLPDHPPWRSGLLRYGRPRPWPMAARHHAGFRYDPH